MNDLTTKSYNFDNGLRAFVYVEDHFISFDGYVPVGHGWAGLSLLGLKSEVIPALLDLVKSLPSNTTYEQLKLEMNKVIK